ncbi:hypothetical protein [Olivibacter jilunii]|uniref:hypothetical protein n=1 Tax=Olivibacter jilunii TaxID=985016 RepID=UPI00102FAACF|nr:hypothetical protein [Olivibacter jilunii]
MNPDSIVERFFDGTEYLVRGKQYHSPIPEELRPWYCYTTDGGHSILALIESHFDPENEELLDEMCPCPVKSVLRKYRIFKGYPVVPLEYNDDIGLVTDTEDDEF